MYLKCNSRTHNGENHYGKFNNNIPYLIPLAHSPHSFVQNEFRNFDNVDDADVDNKYNKLHYCHSIGKPLKFTENRKCT